LKKPTNKEGDQIYSTNRNEQFMGKNFIFIIYSYYYHSYCHHYRRHQYHEKCNAACSELPR